MSDTPEEVLVLYGTQTGNSEAAAEEITSSLSSQLSKLPFKVTPKLLTLDDFLELRHGEWTRVVVIVCSSYGVGQAPLGARKFREWCDEVLERYGHDPADVDGEWVFNQPFFILLNVAVGGNYVGFPTADTPFPQSMYIDYVKVYKQK